MDKIAEILKQQGIAGEGEAEALDPMKEHKDSSIVDWFDIGKEEAEEVPTDSNVKRLQDMGLVGETVNGYPGNPRIYPTWDLLANDDKPEKEEAQPRGDYNLLDLAADIEAYKEQEKKKLLEEASMHPLWVRDCLRVLEELENAMRYSKVLEYLLKDSKAPELKKLQED